MIKSDSRDHVKILILEGLLEKYCKQLGEEGGNPPHHPIQPCSELARCLTESLHGCMGWWISSFLSELLRAPKHNSQFDKIYLIFLSSYDKV